MRAAADIVRFDFTATTCPFVDALSPSVLSELGGLNSHGQVVGLSALSGEQGCTGSLNGCVVDPFFSSDGKMIDLFSSTSGGNPLTANAINDASEIVGAAAFPTQPYAAYLWNSGVATDLGHLNGDCYSEAWAIKSRDQVTGISFSCDSSTMRVFLRQNGAMVDLNSLIPPGSSLQLAVPMAINDEGAIAGVGAPPGVCSNCVNEAGHAFLAALMTETAQPQPQARETIPSTPTSQLLRFWVARQAEKL